jgi:hypothetical protein
MEQSILKSTKKVLQIAPDDTSFDLDILTHINSAFSDLNDIGVGPEDGFVIEDEAPEWGAFVADEEKVRQSRVKTYVYLKVRLLFDPPATTYHLSAAQEQLKEAEWRLNVGQEAENWVDPDPPTTVEEDDEPVLYDGGSA